MGSKADKAAGMANKVVGSVKQGVGKAIGSETLQAKGIAQEGKGVAQKAMGNAKAAVKDAAGKVAEKIKKAL